jgi:4-hydroxymandelate synthase
MLFDARPDPNPPADLTLDHVVLHVGDLEAARAGFVDRYGFTQAGEDGSVALGWRSVRLVQDDIILVLTQGIAQDHPATEYVRTHGDGVADIAMRTSDVTAAYESALAGGARSLAEPHNETLFGRTRFTASIQVPDGLTHTFVQAESGQTGTDEALAGAGSAKEHADVPASAGEARLTVIDHFAVCVPNGSLIRTTDFYTTALAFQATFKERITVGAQAMDSIVVQSRGGVTFTVIEPDVTFERGQIDEFVDRHGGAGVQHIAFATPDITRAIRTLRSRGVVFLTTPGAYYDQLPNRITPNVHPVDQLRGLDILVDEDQDGQLYQIFTRTTHPRRTLFFELVERAGAQTFGSSNIKALYEAVELERSGG